MEDENRLARLSRNLGPVGGPAVKAVISQGKLYVNATDLEDAKSSSDGVEWRVAKIDLGTELLNLAVPCVNAATTPANTLPVSANLEPRQEFPMHTNDREPVVGPSWRVLKWGSDLNTSSLRNADRPHSANWGGLLLLTLFLGVFVLILFFAELPEAMIRTGQTDLHDGRPASGNDHLKK